MDKLLWYAMIVIASCLAGCGISRPHAAVASSPSLVAEAREAGMVAVASPHAATVRVLYARNGGMVLLRDVRVPSGDVITGVSLSADGEDLLIETDHSSYAVSTRTWSTHPARVLALQRVSPVAETVF